MGTRDLEDQKLSLSAYLLSVPPRFQVASQDDSHYPDTTSEPDHNQKQKRLPSMCPGAGEPAALTPLRKEASLKAVLAGKEPNSGHV